MSVDEEPVDLAIVARDAELFEALAAGQAAPRDDEVAAMLAAWRADLVDDIPSVRTPFVTAPPAGGSADGRVSSNGRAGVVPVRRRHRRARVLAAAAAAVVALGGVTTAAASVAGPDNPLWPITRMIFPDRADSRVAQQEAERTIDRAREAVAESRYSDADKLLNEATALIGQIQDQDAARTLLAEVEAVRGLLPGLPGVGLPGATTPGLPGTPQRTPSPTRGTQGGGGGGSDPEPTGGGGGGGGGVPLPTLPPLPTPTLPLPTCLPVIGCD